MAAHAANKHRGEPRSYPAHFHDPPDKGADPRDLQEGPGAARCNPLRAPPRAPADSADDARQQQQRRGHSTSACGPDLAAASIAIVRR